MPDIYLEWSIRNILWVHFAIVRQYNVRDCFHQYSRYHSCFQAQQTTKVFVFHIFIYSLEYSPQSIWDIHVKKRWWKLPTWQSPGSKYWKSFSSRSKIIQIRNSTWSTFDFSQSHHTWKVSIAVRLEADNVLSNSYGDENETLLKVHVKVTWNRLVTKSQWWCGLDKLWCVGITISRMARSFCCCCWGKLFFILSRSYVQQAFSFM